MPAETEYCWYDVHMIVNRLFLPILADSCERLIGKKINKTPNVYCCIAGAVCESSHVYCVAALIC